MKNIDVPIGNHVSNDALVIRSGHVVQDGRSEGFVLVACKVHAQRLQTGQCHKGCESGTAGTQLKEEQERETAQEKSA